ncbi:MAG: hypothetical protein QF926_01350 [Alphaproteobacteria bacterium]|nr:hypothetical protein [Alphaproteobacteria bacterium]
MKKSETASDEIGKPGSGLSSAAVRDQLDRVLASDNFSKSPRMTNFLRFVVSESLTGNAHRLKEYLIAVEVFDRDESFDPKTSAVVRVEASRMRHRLREYFLGPGHDDPIHIELPPGSYVPQFRMRVAGSEDGAAGSLAAVADSGTPLALPDKPSIAVLPFASLGDDPQQEYFADGIAEDLITALSRVHWLFVTARNSTFTYKGRAVDVKRVGHEMGVRYVVEGSVRQARNRIRISAQLIDAITGNHLWADRYDRELEDIFVLQDEITETIAAAIEPELGTAERERAVRRPPESLEAWGLYQRGLDLMYRFTAEDNQEARRLFRLAADADTRFASPLGALAYIGFLDFVLGFTESPEQTIAEAVAAGRASVARDDKDPMAHFGLGRAMSLTRNLESAISELAIAIELNPNFALAYLGLGAALSLAGRYREAIDALDVAIRLSPHAPILWTMEHMRAGAYRARRI